MLLYKRPAFKIIAKPKQRVIRAAFLLLNYIDNILLAAFWILFIVLKI